MRTCSALAFQVSVRDSPGRISAGATVKAVIEIGTEVPTGVNVGKGVWSGVMGIAVLLADGGRVAAGNSSAVGAGTEVSIESNVEVGIGGGVRVIGISTT